VVNIRQPPETYWRSKNAKGRESGLDPDAVRRALMTTARDLGPRGIDSHNFFFEPLEPFAGCHRQPKLGHAWPSKFYSPPIGAEPVNYVTGAQDARELLIGSLPKRQRRPPMRTLCLPKIMSEHSGGVVPTGLER
jgi:hypothetical protein